MILGALTFDPNAGCDIQTDIVERLRAVNFGTVVAPIITADKRSVDETGAYIVVRVQPPGVPIKHGSKSVFLHNVLIIAYVSNTDSPREDAVTLINTAESTVRGAGKTPYEEYCLLHGLPQVEKIADASYAGNVIMRATVARYNT